jgi:hypothetical protein
MNNDTNKSTEAQPPKQADVLHSVNLMSGAVAGVLSIGMIIDKHSVTTSVLSGMAFYGAIAGIMVLTPIIINHQDNVTIRRRDELPYRYMPQPQTQRMELVDPVRLQETTATMLPYSNFVAPLAEPDDSAKREAVAWLMQLYGADGEPDPKKVLLKTDKERPGRVRIAAPSRPAKEYLLERGAIHDLGSGYRLALARCPTRDAAMAFLDRAYGVGRYPTEYQGLPTTQTEVGE